VPAHDLAVEEAAATAETSNMATYSRTTTPMSCASSKSEYNKFTI